MQHTFNDLTPRVVLGVAAHPDDLDFGAGGTMAQFAAQGAKVYYLILTDGSKGTEDRAMNTSHLVELRREEQRAAGNILGLADVFFLNYTDGELENCLDVKRSIVRTIRQVQPDVVITWDPTCAYCVDMGFVNHPDHRASGQATMDAVFPLARDHLAFPELLAEGLQPHKTGTLLLMNFAQHNFGVDIGETLALKKRAIAAHQSQAPNLEHMLELFTQFASAHGAQHGHQYAESFMRVDVR